MFIETKKRLRFGLVSININMISKVENCPQGCFIRLSGDDCVESAESYEDIMDKISKAQQHNKS